MQLSHIIAAFEACNCEVLMARQRNAYIWNFTVRWAKSGVLHQVILKEELDMYSSLQNGYGVYEVWEVDSGGELIEGEVSAEYLPGAIFGLCRIWATG